MCVQKQEGVHGMKHIVSVKSMWSVLASWLGHLPLAWVDSFQSHQVWVIELSSSISKEAGDQVRWKGILIGTMQHEQPLQATGDGFSPSLASGWGRGGGDHTNFLLFVEIVQKAFVLFCSKFKVTYNKLTRMLSQSKSFSTKPTCSSLTFVSCAPHKQNPGLWQTLSGSPSSLQTDGGLLRRCWYLLQLLRKASRLFSQPPEKGSFLLASRTLCF